jgi:RNA polymerase nonessential primary-like sigma factor
MTFRETTVRLNDNIDLGPSDIGVQAPDQLREVTAASDPIRRYLVEATRTPLLTVEQERRLAVRMARRRASFITAACGIPSLWIPAARLARKVLRGEMPALKVFMIGGISEKKFHKHLSRAAESVARLEEVAAEMQRLGCTTMHDQVALKKLWREGRDLCSSLTFRLPTLVRLLKEAQRLVRERATVNRRGRRIPCANCSGRIREAFLIHGSFVETRNALVSANLRLVVFIARQVARHPSQLLELIQEGNFGLLYATEKYDARERCQFHSYAYWWIRQSMTRAVANKSRLIRQPVNLQDAPAKIREAIAAYRAENGRDPTPEELGKTLNLPRGEAERVFRTPVRTFSLDQAPRGEEDSPLADLLADPHAPDSPADAKWVLEGLDKVLHTLAPREREVLLLRFGLGHDQTYTLEDVAKIYNLSRERVRQIEIRALEKLRQPDRARPLKALMDAVTD